MSATGTPCPKARTGEIHGGHEWEAVGGTKWCCGVHPKATSDGSTLLVNARVELVRWAVGASGYDDNQNVPMGTKGTVIEREEPGGALVAVGAWVAWDNGARMKLLYNEDLWKVLS